MTISRRHVLHTLGSAAIAPAITPLVAAVADGDESPPMLATNTYPWSTFASRAGGKLELHTDALLADIASTGITGYEPIVNGPAELAGLGERLKKHGLTMRSVYVNSVLHDSQAVNASVAGVLAIAKAARDVGTKIVVTNPSPIRWGDRRTSRMTN